MGRRSAYSTHDVARICRVAPMTVIRWIEDGKLVAFKTAGGHRRILPADLECFCRTHGIPIGQPVPGRIVLAISSAGILAELEGILREEEPEMELCPARDGFCAGFLAATARTALLFLEAGLPGVDPLEVGAKLDETRLVVVGAPEEQARTLAARGVLILGLPLARESLDGLLGELREGRRADAVRGTAPRGATIVVLDRDPEVVSVLARITERDWPGLKMAVTGSGEELFALVESLAPEIASVDLGLPGADPIELIRALAAGRSGSSTAVIAVTDTAHRHLEPRALEAGARAVLERAPEPERVFGLLSSIRDSAARTKRGPLRRLRSGWAEKPGSTR